MSIKRPAFNSIALIKFLYSEKRLKSIRKDAVFTLFPFRTERIPPCQKEKNCMSKNLVLLSFEIK